MRQRPSRASGTEPAAGALGLRLRADNARAAGPSSPPPLWSSLSAAPRPPRRTTLRESEAALQRGESDPLARERHADHCCSTATLTPCNYASWHDVASRKRLRYSTWRKKKNCAAKAPWHWWGRVDTGGGAVRPFNRCQHSGCGTLSARLQRCSDHIVGGTLHVQQECRGVILFC